MNFIFNNVSPIMFPIILSIVIIGTIVVGIELLCQHYDENNDNKKNNMKQQTSCSIRKANFF